MFPVRSDGKCLADGMTSMHGSRNLVYMTFTVCEEAFESASIILFTISLLIYKKDRQEANPASSPSGNAMLNISIQD